MTLIRTSDTLSRCTRHDDAYLYSTSLAPRPLVPRQTPSSSHFEKDTLSFSREALHEEALHRLRHMASYLVIHPGFLRVGKVLFSAALLPTRLLFLTVPSWLLTHTLIPLFQISVYSWQGIVHHCWQPIITRAGQVVRPFYTIGRHLSSVVHSFLLASRQFLFKATLSVRRIIRTFIPARTLPPLAPLLYHSKYLIALASARISATWRHLATALKRQGNRMHTIQKTKGRSFIQIGIASLSTTLVVPLLSLLNSCQQLMTQSFLSIRPLRVPFSPARETAQQHLATLARYLTFFFSQTKIRLITCLQRALSSISHWGTPLSHLAMKGVKKIWNRMVHHRERAVHLLYEALKHLNHTSADRWASSLLYHPSLTALPLRMHQLLNQIVTHPLIASLLYHIVRLFLFIVATLVSLPGWLCHQVISKRWQSLASLSLSLRTFLSRFASRTMALARRSRLLLQHVCYTILLWGMMVAILCQWGMQGMWRLMRHFLR